MKQEQHYKRKKTRKLFFNNFLTFSGERPYVCTKCGNSFSDPSTLLKHNKRHARRENGQNQKDKPDTQGSHQSQMEASEEIVESEGLFLLNL